MSFHSKCCDHHHNIDKIQLTADFNLSRLIKNYIEEFFQEKKVSNENRATLWNYYYNKLSGGLYKGFTYNDKELAQSLKNSIAQFSAFKETSFRSVLEDLLTKDGKLTPWSEFKTEAYKVDIDYNQRYLETEYHQTIANAQSAAKWLDFQDNKELYPNLMFITVGDDRVRPEHEVLNGVIKPLDDPFWNSYYPPLDWGCRCSVEQTDAEPTSVKGGEQLKIEFNNNPGETGSIFGTTAYEEGLTEAQRIEAIDFANEQVIKLETEAIYKNTVFTEDGILNSNYYKKALNINDTFTPIEAFTINEYTGGGYEVNELIRTADHLDEYWSAFKNTLNRALDKLENYEGIVYRGESDMPQAVVNKYETAFLNKETITHNHFTSTSIDKEIADRDFGTKVQFKINSKTGKHIKEISGFDYENEVLFKTNTKFEVISFEKKIYDGYSETLIELFEL